MKKTHWKKAYKSDYLGASDIDNELQVEIEKVVYKECTLSTGKQYCNVAIFKDSSIKPMILNVTNSKILKKFAKNSSYIEDWENIMVTIYVDHNVRLGKDTVDGLRFRQYQPTIQKKLVEFPKDKINDAVTFIKSGKKSLAELKKIYKISAEIEKEIIKGLENE